MVEEKIKTNPRQTSSVPALEATDVTMRFNVDGISKTVLDRVSFAAYHEEFTCIVGQSGCGKTTLLNIMAGFLAPSEGQVTVMGTAIRRPGPDRCVVFQEDTLFPWLTVRENIAFGLKGNRKNSAQHIKDEVDRFLTLVGLADYRNYLPREISSGMKQRVELARVLILKPRIILMDEPFASLDYRTRREMQNLLVSLWQELSQTIIFVTHDVDEAIVLGDKIEIMDINPGRIHEELHIQLDRPRNINQRDFASYKDTLHRFLCD